MDADMKDKPTEGEKTKFLGQAGWVKKAPGRILASYKDRYVKVEKTEILVYENEDQQTCIERLDLENYEKCLELKSTFKKKHRLILIRSAKPGNKVSDVKFQVQSAEEKEAWIKALKDGINRAQNKVFDEVKVDESSNLEHVTRTRPKGNRNRRPPTRIHLKEVADVSSDGILRLDLDLEDAVMPNGTHHANTEGTASTNDVIKDWTQMLSSDEQDVSETSPKKVIIKPPMPPTKKFCVVLEDEPDGDGAPQKDPGPPKAPPKDAKPSITLAEEDAEGSDPETILGNIPDDRVDTGSPPTPPNKSSSSCLIEDSPHSPIPPAKEMKPSCPALDPDEKPQTKADENKESSDEMTRTALETDKEDLFVSKQGVESVTKDAIPDVEEPQERENPMESAQTDTQHMQDVPSVNEGHNNTASLPTASNTADASPLASTPTVKGQIAAVVSSNEPFTDSLSLSPLLGHLPDKKQRSEEKSLDSGQHSDNDSEGSVSEYTTVASTVALRRSHASLDVLDVSEGNVQISGQLSDNVLTKPQVKSKVFPLPHHKPTVPLKPKTKPRAASIGNLLSDSAVCIHVGQRAEAQSDRPPTANVMKLEVEVAREMEKTDELLRMSQFQNAGDGDNVSENLLVEAMEKLKKADRVLREVKKMKLANHQLIRNSW